MLRPAPLLVAALVAVGVASADDPSPVPAAVDQERATKLVRELFKAEYAKTTPKARAALAAKLFDQGAESKADPVAQFVLYREAADLAAAAGEIDLALKATDALRDRFDGLKADHHEPLFRTLVAKAAADGSLSLANHLLRLTDEAVSDNDLDAAAKLVKLAESAAGKGKSPKLAAAAVARGKDVEAFKKDAPAVEAARDALQKDVNDGAASTVLGGHYCFQRGEWEKGLSLLANGKDAKLKAVAELENARPAAAADLLAVAEGWYDAAAAAPAGPGKRAMQARAFGYYAKAAPDLAGLNRTKAEKRVEELEKLVEGPSQHEDLFAAVRTAVRAKEFEFLTPVGGFITRKDFRDAAPSGGVLVGFRYTTKLYNNDHLVMDFLQPIYLTPFGEKYGAGFGGPVPAGVKTIKAKAGYAVGAVRVRGGGLLEGMAVQYLKIQGRALNPADAYESPWLGRTPAPPPGFGRASGDGRPAFGIHGKLRPDGNEEVVQLGLVVAGKAPPRKN